PTDVRVTLRLADARSGAARWSTEVELEPAQPTEPSRLLATSRDGAVVTIAQGAIVRVDGRTGRVLTRVDSATLRRGNATLTPDDSLDLVDLAGDANRALALTRVMATELHVLDTSTGRLVASMTVDSSIDPSSVVWRLSPDGARVIAIHAD